MERVSDPHSRKQCRSDPRARAICADSCAALRLTLGWEQAQIGQCPLSCSMDVVE